jgi:hypothetical protein
LGCIKHITIINYRKVVSPYTYTQLQPIFKTASGLPQIIKFGGPVHIKEYEFGGVRLEHKNIFKILVNKMAH